MGQSTDLLVIILIVAIVAVVLDGLRRKWRDRQDRVVMKLDKSFLRGGADAPDDVLTSSELPNGGARTVTRTGTAPPPRKSWSRLKNGKHRGQEDAAPATERAKGETVPVLMDTVDVEETDIEHANVFVSTEPSQQFTPEAFDDEPSPARVRSNSNVVEDKDMLDAQVEGLDQLRRDPLAPQAGRKSDYDDEDEFEDEEEEFEDDEDDEDEFDDEEDDEEFEDDDWEEDEDDEEEEDEEGYPRRVRRAGDDEEWEDDEDDWDDEDEEEDDEDEDEEDDEDDWGEEEDENYSADYENEPALLEETYTRAASHFARQPVEPPQARIEPGFGEGEAALDDLNEEELLAESFSESFTEVFEDEGLDTEGLEHFNAEPANAGAVRAAVAEKAEKAVEKKTEARDAAKDAKDKRSFFGKSLLGRQQQVDLFQDDAIVEEEEVAEEPVVEDTGPREVVIINVMARPGYNFNGGDLLAVVREQGLQLGDMSIFHRHEQKDGGGRVLFSMANLVKPGTFNLAAMDDFTTPGVSLFLQLPCKSGNMAAFDLMLGTALALREQLDGELKDEQRSVFTRQTIEHVRQRIRDFELALLSRR